MGYLDILEDTLLAYRLPAFDARLRVRERKHPKLYWIDPGIVRAIKRQAGSLASEERGALLEGWIAMILRAYAEIRGTADEVYYWAPANSHRLEVDFVLKLGRQFLAVEVKSSPKISNPQLSGLRAIGDLPGIERRILVYRGRRNMRTEDGIEIWPVELFLHNLASSTLWP
jgi:predicted AAA+ superfamily ATPase